MRRFFAYAFAAFMMLATIVAAPQAQAHDHNSDRSIVGTWILTTTFDMPPGAPPFIVHEFAQFNEGGTFLGNFELDNNSANPLAPPPFAVDFSTKYGSWKQKWHGSPQYNVILQEYIIAGQNTPTAIYGEFYPGQTVGIVTVKATPALNRRGDTFNGPFSYEFKNMAGDLLFAGTGNFVGKRQKLQ
jgi:hypothetical protein